MFKTLYPPSVQWEITPLCNQNCIHCYNHYRTDFDSIANTFLSSEDYFLSIAKKLIENKPLSVTITGGEPLLVWNKIKSSIKLFRENDILVNLNTNAILVNQEIAEFLYSYRISCFVSLPTSDPILCDFITSSHQSLEKISKGVKILREFNARDNKRKIKAEPKFESKVALIKITPSQDPKILDFLAGEGYKGIILELFGLGQAPAQDSDNNWLPTIKRLVDKGIIICGAPQTIFGRLNPNVYSAGRDLQKTGLIFLKDMLSETAFIKLGWILGHSSWVKENKVQEKMLENLAGEFNNKISP